jgi:hypothetical protein
MLKRLDTLGRTEMIERIDTYILWGYPLFYLLGGSFLCLLFFL